MTSKELRAKLEYYIISLSFTVLAFSIQTVGSKTIYKFDNETFKFILFFFEFPSWICFALSGSIGIAKLLKISRLLNFTEKKSESSEYNTDISKLDNLVNKLEFSQYIFLGLGFCLLILSRILSIGGKSLIQLGNL